MHVRHNVWRIAHEVEAHAPGERIVLCHGLPRESVAHIQPVNLVVEIIPMIERPPSRRNPPEADTILHDLVGTQVVTASDILRTARADSIHPRRRPGHVLHNAVHALAFARPLHRRGPHILPHGHQRVHELPRRLFIVKNSLQSCARQELLGADVASQSTHRCLLRDVALAPRFLQQHRVHHRPHEAVTTHAMHTPATPESKEVLRPDFRRDLLLAFPLIIEETTNPHRKLQRMRPLEPTH